MAHEIEQWIAAMSLLRQMQQWHMRPDHMQFLYQLMREGPAVDRSDQLAAGDGAMAHEAGCDHILFTFFSSEKDQQ